MAIYRAWARGDRRRLDGAPSGRNRLNGDTFGFEQLSRRDIEKQIDDLFASDGAADAESNRDRYIEGRLCRGEDLDEVRNFYEVQYSKPIF